VLSEALATSVILKTKDTDKPLHRVLAFDAAWIAATARSEDTPIAGTVATASVTDKPEVIAAFAREYEAAVKWMLSDPEAAGKLVETELPELGLKAAVMTASLKNITWKYTPAADALWFLNRFYGRLMELSPEIVGGQLPADGFYYAP
jgi:NitT/TauT family transport system substrate-binding protein